MLVRWSSEPAARDTPGRVMVAIVGPGVAGVRAAGYGTFRAHHVGGLPAGYKAVVFYYAKWPAAATERVRTRQGLEQLARRIEQLPRLVQETLLEGGRGAAVIQQRMEFQELMRERFEEVIEHATGRPVIGFMSGNQQHPDMMCEVFILARTDLLDAHEIAANGRPSLLG